MIPKMKLKVTALEILVTELLPAEMMAIYLMASGSAMPGKVSKEDLTKVIRILCKKLDWIEDEEDDTIIPSAILSQSLVIDEETESADHLLNGLKEKDSNHEEENVDPILTGDIRSSSDCDDINDWMDDWIGEKIEEVREPNKNAKKEKSFNCRKCDKVFHNSYVWKRHEQSHSGTKPYSCSQCGKAFTQKWNMVNHVRAHTNEKPFSCTLCDKKFANQRNLTQHGLTHSDFKKYSCLKCNEKFSRPFSLNRHDRCGNKLIFYVTLL